MKREEDKKKKIPRTETIYNVEIERRLLTEHHFEKAVFNLKKLSRLPEITTVEIVLDTIQSSLEVILDVFYWSCSDFFLVGAIRL
jgi:hypothetical protein